jgi:tripartite-type tricarboxylate transporter receptor subunit TctC
MHHLRSRRCAAVFAVSAIAAASLLTPGEVSAQPAVADFYKGKQIRMVIRTAAGGSYDLYSRLIGRHIGRYIPGNPTVVPINMPGGGGLASVNHIAQIAPKDGTSLIIPSLGIAMYQALDFFGENLKADMGEFQWIGNVSTSNPLVATWHAAKVKTLDDARREVAHLGTSGAGSISSQLPAVYNNLLGTKFKVIYGYDGEEASIAMERMEIDGRASNTWASYKATTPAWVRDKKLNLLLQVGLQKEPELPDVPLLLDLARNDEERQIFGFFSKVAALTRPMATGPGVPPDRVAALRKAFMDTMSDPEFLSEAAKLNAEVGPTMDGETVQRLTLEILKTPKPLLEKVRSVMKHREGDEITPTKK